MSTGQQGSAGTETPGSSVAAAGPARAADSSANVNPASKGNGGKARAGTASPPPAKVEGLKMPGKGGKGKATEESNAARADIAVVRVVSSGDGKSRAKRLLKKGHAPPGAIEEDACDLIRDHFWDRNPHILGGASAATRR